MKAAAFAAIPLLANALCAQTAPGATFETASIKPTPPDAQCGMIQPMPGGGLRIECLNLKTILVWAYDVQNYQISGGPAWAESQRWDILAKPAAMEGATSGPAEYANMDDSHRKQYMSAVRQRLQALLADRFQLALRHEMREQTVYVLAVAKGGPKMKESANQSESAFIKRGRGQITARGAQMEGLIRFLAIDVQRPITDRTGLTRHYDFTLEWTPDPPANAESHKDSPDASGPTVFTALQEQLGLRLESQKGPVETLVIDRAEKPEN
jgi:uncharacterized protein (TIGR03435 family)